MRQGFAQHPRPRQSAAMLRQTQGPGALTRRVALLVAGVTETVQVTGNTYQTVNTETANVETLISGTQVTELAPYGVRVNAVSPGVIDTPYHERFSTPEAMKGYVAGIPLGRVGTPAEVASVIAFLASDAASYLSGETIEINGGMLML
ncbi:MAG TPA: SDR family oxidoreductase [Pyrinomonadaceae bacterium]